MHHVFARRQLYDLVWSEPKTLLAKRLGLSDVGFAKACRKADIPMPERGYWAKKKAGKRTIQVALPPRGFGARDGVQFGQPTAGWYQSALDDTEPIEPPEYDESMASVVNRAGQALKGMRAKATLDPVHPVLAPIVAEDERRREALRNSTWAWQKPRFETASDQRRLKILNGLFLAMSSLGARPTVSVTDDIEASVIVGVVHVKVSLADPDRRARTAGGGKAPAPGRSRLRLEISGLAGIEGTPGVWEDGESGRIDTRLPEIAKSILVAGEAGYRATCFRHYEWRMKMREDALRERDRRIAEAKRLEAERRQKRQNDLRALLIRDARSVQQAEQIRGYVAAVASRIFTNSPTANDEELKRWSDWALREAERLDPLSRSAMQLLADYSEFDAVFEGS